jgi:hypothetical protein
VQIPATRDASLVMRLGQRFESARRLFILPAKPIKREKPAIRCAGAWQQ